MVKFKFNLKDISDYVHNIRDFPNAINWYSISENYHLPSDFIREFHNYLNWDSISYYQ